MCNDIWNVACGVWPNQSIITIREVADDVSMSFGMEGTTAKIVLKLLNFKQKQHRMDIAWVYGYDFEIKAQSFQWKHPEEPRQKTADQIRTNVKVLLAINSCSKIVR